jgi:hypothetical protein
MAPPATLAYRMVEVFLAEIFPHEVFRPLAPQFHHAGQGLDQIDKSTLKDWPCLPRVYARVGLGGTLPRFLSSDGIVILCISQ